jgi:uncharacterized protein YcnI
MQRQLFVIGIALLAVATRASAHVTLQPRESAPGETVTYTVRVPTEGTVATTGIELEIPEVINVISVDGAVDTYDLKRAGDRIIAISWKADIQPKQFKTFTFVAKNPSAASEIAWKAHQRFADGTTADWVEPAGSKRPAPRTRIVVAGDKAPVPAEHKH